MTRDETKARILEVLEKLLENKPLNKIVISEITDASNVSRQTFYYYFKNIYDVFLWAVRSRMKYNDVSASGRFAPSPCECLVDLCDSLKHRRKLVYEFIENGYAQQMKDDLRAYLYEVSLNNLGYLLGATNPKSELDVLARFHSEGYVGIVRDWVIKGMTYNIRDEFENLRSAFRMIMDPGVVGRAESNVLRC